MQDHLIELVLGEVVHLLAPADLGYEWLARTRPPWLELTELDALVTEDMGIGGPSKQRFAAVAKEAGQCTLQLDYVRSFEPDKVLESRQVQLVAEGPDSD